MNIPGSIASSRAIAPPIALAVVLAGLGQALAAPQGLPEAPTSTIGYPTPQAALSALRADRAITEHDENDWRVFNDARTRTVWSIAAETHPAYPTAVRRQLVERDGHVEIAMDILCGASKAVCDGVVVQFREINDKLRAGVAAGDAPLPPPTSE